MFNRRILIAAIAATAILCGGPALAQDKSIIVSSTTSTQDSGLFGYILPLFKQKTGIEVKVIAQGTGQALDTGRRGDADVVFVHAKSAEEKFLALDVTDADRGARIKAVISFNLFCNNIRSFFIKRYMLCICDHSLFHG